MDSRDRGVEVFAGGGLDSVPFPHRKAQGQFATGFERCETCRCGCGNACRGCDVALLRRVLIGACGEYCARFCKGYAALHGVGDSAHQLPMGDRCQTRDWIERGCRIPRIGKWRFEVVQQRADPHHQHRQWQEQAADQSTKA